MRVLVTGAAGFVGRVAAQAAAARGWEVLGASRTKQAPLGFPGVWAGGEALPGLLADFVPDLVIHAAGSASVRDSFTDSAADFQASVGTLATLLEAVRKSAGNAVVVFPSSAAVYGNPDSLPIREDALCHPLSPYGWHKHLCEELAKAHANLWGTKIVLARMFSVLGPSQKRLLVWELADRLQRSGTIELLGSGHESRDYLYETEMAAALLDLGLAARESASTPLIVNVASGEETSTLTVAQTLAEVAAPNCPIVCRGAALPGDPERWCADVTLLKSLLPAWKPASFRESLGKTLQSWRENIS